MDQEEGKPLILLKQEATNTFLNQAICSAQHLTHNRFSIFVGLEWVAAAAGAKSLQSCPTLCDPIDGSPPGSTVPGIIQARVLEWGAIAFSKKVS